MKRALASILRLATTLLLAGGLSAAASPAVATADAPTEQRVRAAVLFNFLKLTEWPATVGNELRLCIASGDPSLVAAIESLSGRTLMARRVLTLRFHGEARCDAIYVDSRRHWNHFLEEKLPRHVLTVGGYAGFARDGGMIEVVAKDGTTRYSLNLAEAKKAGLRFHPEMLRLAGLAEPTVWLALAEDGGAYAEAAAAAEADIKRAGPGHATVVVRPWHAFPGDLHAPPSLIVAVGSEALRGIIGRGIKAPVLALLVPESAYERLLKQAGAAGTSHSAVLLDQPPARQIAALRLALPERQRIGMLFGPESRRQAAAFQRAAMESGARLVAGQVDSPESVGSVLQRTIEDSDLLLAVPDPVVFNNASVQNILTTAYRRHIPVAAFSPAYVRAGALLAIYSTPSQVGRQAGEMARVFLSGRPLPAPQAPKDFTIGINGEVARSLGIPLRATDGAALAAQLQAQENKP